MFFSILKWILISLTLIFLIHHFYNFLMNTLTVPKIKDLVNKPTQQYRDIYATIAKAMPAANGMQNANGMPTANTNGMPAPNNAGIADELSSFLNDLKKTAPEKKNNDFETLSSDIGYALY